MISFNRKTGPTDEPTRDMELAETLSSLDPASVDPNYWFRFHGRVMAGAGTELARRRMMAGLTVGDVLASWSRTLVPTAMLAAAVAALMLIRTGSASLQGPVTADGLLSSSDEVVPVMLPHEAPTAFASFAAEIF